MPRTKVPLSSSFWPRISAFHDPRQDRTLPQNRGHCQEGPPPGDRFQGMVCQMSDVRCQMSDVRCQMSNVKCQRASSRRRLTDGKRRIAERNWLLAPRPALLAVDKKSIGRRQENPEGLPRRRPDLCLGMDLLAGISVRSPAHHLVQHPVKSEFELFWCFVTSGCDLPANLLHFLVADLRQLADAVEHLSQGGDLDMIARAPACTV